VIFNSPRTPAGFYSEETGQDTLYYENTISVAPVSMRGDVWRELCTDDAAQALSWSDASNNYDSQKRDLVAQAETEKYFEFQRTGGLRSRVHKCSYIDRSALDKLHPGPAMGTLNLRPITADRAKEVVEYLWFIDNQWIAGHKVLSTQAEVAASSVIYIFDEAEIGLGDFGLCDQIVLFKSTYSVDLSSGDISRTRGEQGKLMHCH